MGLVPNRLFCVIAGSTIASRLSLRSPIRTLKTLNPKPCQQPDASQKDCQALLQVSGGGLIP